MRPTRDSGLDTLSAEPGLVLTRWPKPSGHLASPACCWVHASVDYIQPRIQYHTSPKVSCRVTSFR